MPEAVGSNPANSTVPSSGEKTGQSDGLVDGEFDSYSGHNFDFGRETYKRGTVAQSAERPKPEGCRFDPYPFFASFGAVGQSAERRDAGGCRFDPCRLQCPVV